MSRYLLDTHVLIWWLADDPKLQQTTIDIMETETNELFVSAASTWEISIKRSQGKLQIDANIHEVIRQEGFLELPIRNLHGELAGRLPPHHKDPFDRMLVAQASQEGMMLLTHDTVFEKYDVPVIWV